MAAGWSASSGFSPARRRRTELSNYVDALGHRIPVHCFENEPGPLPLSAEDLARFYEEVAAEEFA